MLNAPRKFVSMIRRALSIGVRAIAFIAATPALLMRTSSVLNRSRISLKSPSTAAASLTSTAQCVYRSCAIADAERPHPMT
jgi:hypothetical protein